MTSRIGRRLFGVVTTCAVLLASGCNSPPDFGTRVFGYVDTQGRVVIRPVYLDARPFHEARAAVRTRTGWGFIDAEGRWIVAPRYGQVESFSDGRARVRDRSGVWGYVDLRGVPVISPQYTCESPFFSGHAYVQPVTGPVRLIDLYGHTVRELPDVKLILMDCSLDSALRSSGYSAWDAMAASWDEQRLDALRASHLYPAELIPATPPAMNPGPGTTDKASPGRGLPEVKVSPESQEEIGYLDSEGRWAIAPMPLNGAGPFVDGLARVERGKKFGFIDRQGHIVVPLKFEDALLRFSRDRTVAVRDGQAWLIDRSGKQIADLGRWPWPYLREGEDFNSLAYFVGLSDFFSDGLIPWQHHGGWAYVDLTGKWHTASVPYTSAQPFHEGFATVQRGDRWILIGVNGNPVAEPQTGWIGPSNGRLVRVGTLSRWGFAPPNNPQPETLPFATTQLAFGPTSFVDTQPLKFSEGLAVVSMIARPLWQLMDRNGRSLGSGRYEDLTYVGRDRFVYLDENRWGLLDTHLRIVVPAEFEISTSLAVFRDGFAFARSRELGGCIDRDGRWAFSPQPVLTASCDNSEMTAQAATGWGVLGMDGRWRIPPRYDSITHLAGGSGLYFVVTKDDRAQLARLGAHGPRYSARGVLSPCLSPDLCMMNAGIGVRRLDPQTLRLTGPVFDEADSYGLSVVHNVVVMRAGFRGTSQRAGTADARVRVRIGKQWGVLAESGRFAVPMAYDKIATDYSSSESRPAVLVRRRGKWGVVSLMNGRILVPVRFDELEGIGGGYYAVRLRGLWGVVRNDGRQTIAPRFDEVLKVTNGMILVRRKGQDSLVTVTGRAVLDPLPPWMRHIDRLSDYSSEAWDVVTKDDRVYIIDKRTLATHELHAPTGYVWRPDGFSSRVMTVGLSGSKGRDISGAVLLGADGRMISSTIFSQATWSSAAKRFTVERDGHCGVLDSRGHPVVPIRYDQCSVVTPAWVLVGRNVP